MTVTQKTGSGRLRRLSIHSLALAASGAVWLAGASGQSQSAKNSGRFVIVIDAAHGGDDGGARLGDAADGQQGAQISEKTVTLAMSVRLRSLLTARGFTVVTTREGNANMDSDARAGVANRAVAAASGSACVSLHASEVGAGVHIFVSSLASSAQTRFAAWKTAQSGYVARSLKFAGVVNSAFEHSSVAGGDGGSGSGPIPATLGRASLPEIDSMTCPALAVEIAPIRTADHTILTDVTDAQYQAQVAQALANALLEWKTEVETGGDAGSHTGSIASGGQTP